MVVVVENRRAWPSPLQLQLVGAGYSVVVATDGCEAVGACVDELPAAVVMDMSLEPPAAWPAAQLLRTDTRTRSVPVLVIVRSDCAHDSARARMVGASATFLGPVAPAMILSRLEELRRVRKLLR